MKTRPIAYLLVLLSTVFTSAGQIFWKLGASSVPLNIFVLTGFALNGIATVVLVYAFKNGQFSTLYPFIGLTFVWVSFLSILYLDETMTVSMWLGVMFIVSGVMLTGYSEGGK